MAVQKQLYTIEEFVRFAEQPENADREFELINGEIIEKMPGRTSNSELRDLIAFFVRLYCRERNIPCYTSGEAGAFRIGTHVLVPDFAYKRTPMSDEYPDPVAPEWVVEVISPTDTAGDIRRKRAIYLAARILLWEIYPEDHTVDVYAPGQPVRTYGIEDTIAVGDMIPGFTLAAREIFAR
jgi:Uma2 family endonuclease